MPPQIYVTASGIFPLKISERFNIRPSTLSEYQAEFIVLKGSAIPSGFSINSAISTQVGTVYVFPGAQLSKSNNEMFDTITVTAYGDAAGTNSRTISSSSITEVSKSFSVIINEGQPNAQTFNWTIYESWRTDTSTAIRAVLSSSTLLPSVSTPPNPRFRKRRIIGAVAPGGQTTLSISWTLDDLDISRTNFGMVDEVSLTKGYLPNIS